MVVKLTLGMLRTIRICLGTRNGSSTTRSRIWRSRAASVAVFLRCGGRVDGSHVVCQRWIMQPTAWRLIPSSVAISVLVRRALCPWTTPHKSSWVNLLGILTTTEIKHNISVSGGESRSGGEPSRAGWAGNRAQWEDRRGHCWGLSSDTPSVLRFIGTTTSASSEPRPETRPRSVDYFLPASHGRAVFWRVSRFNGSISERSELNTIPATVQSSLGAGHDSPVSARQSIYPSEVRTDRAGQPTANGPAVSSRGSRTLH